MTRYSDTDSPTNEHLVELFSGVDEGKREIMSSIYASTFSTGAMIRLKRLISALRSLQGRGCPYSRMTVTQIFQELDNLEGSQCSGVLRRRTLLYNLANLKIELLETVHEHRTQRSRMNVDARQGKATSETKDLLTKEIYPHISFQSERSSPRQWRQRYETERKAVDNRLRAARNWKQATSHFPLGILAILPFGEDSTLQNSR